MRRAAALEATDLALVLDRVGRLQSQLLDSLLLLLGVRRGNGGLVASDPSSRRTGSGPEGFGHAPDGSERASCRTTWSSPVV